MLYSRALIMGRNLYYLHSHLSVVNEHFSREEVGADRGLVAGTELLVDLRCPRSVRLMRGAERRVWQRRLRETPRRCRSIGTYILVHQTGLADTAVAKDDDLQSSRDVSLCGAKRGTVSNGAHLEQDLLPGRHCCERRPAVNRVV